MNYFATGDTFLTVLRVPHGKAAGNGPRGISASELSSSAKTWTCTGLSGIELVLSRYTKTIIPFALSTNYMCPKLSQQQQAVN